MLKWQSIYNLEALVLNMNSDSWQNVYLFISQEKHTFMIINIVVGDLLWNGKAENTLSRVKTMSHMFKALDFTTWEKHSLPCGYQAAQRYEVRWQMSHDILCDTDIVHLVSENNWGGRNPSEVVRVSLG